jgi:hypothetical protein
MPRRSIRRRDIARQCYSAGQHSWSVDNGLPAFRFPFQRCQDRSMFEGNAELSSLATVLDELTHRVTRNAEAAAAAHDEEVASELFAIERALGGASRRLSRLSVSQDRKARR